MSSTFPSSLPPLESQVVGARANIYQESTSQETSRSERWIEILAGGEKDLARCQPWRGERRGGGRGDRVFGTKAWESRSVKDNRRLVKGSEKQDQAAGPPSSDFVAGR